MGVPSASDRLVFGPFCLDVGHSFCKLALHACRLSRARLGVASLRALGHTPAMEDLDTALREEWAGVFG
jgi:hypothetical protein